MKQQTRKIFIDCGAHDGCSLKLFKKLYKDYKDFEVYSFECHEGRYNKLKQTGETLGFSQFECFKQAVWINNGHKEFNGWELNNTNSKNDNGGIESIDLSNFISNNFSKNDYIILKLDIEGAEYKVVDKMHQDETLGYISKFYGELHGPKKGYTIKDNELLLQKLGEVSLNLYNWDALGENNTEEIIIVPFNTSGSYTNASSPRVGHAYKKINNG